jgi:hypothetical protein
MISIYVVHLNELSVRKILPGIQGSEVLNVAFFSVLML